MSKLEEKIKALLRDEDMQNLLHTFANKLDDKERALDAALDLLIAQNSLLATRYAKQYGVTWEQLVEHCINTYSRVAVDKDKQSVEVYSEDSHENSYFYRDGSGCCVRLSIKPQTLAIWGRYLEGLRDE